VTRRHSSPIFSLYLLENHSQHDCEQWSTERRSGRCGCPVPPRMLPSPRITWPIPCVATPQKWTVFKPSAKRQTYVWFWSTARGMQGASMSPRLSSAMRGGWSTTGARSNLHMLSGLFWGDGQADSLKGGRGHVLWGIGSFELFGESAAVAEV
jgi:hypothetical protein